MAKKKSKKKTETKKAEEPKKQEKKSVKEHVSKHMNKNVKVGTIIGIVLVLAILFFPVRYEATETYTELNEYEEEYPATEQVSLGEQEVCVEVPAQVKEEPDPLSPFVKASGKEYVCHAELRVWNMDETIGEWTYKYIFNVNGKDFETDPITREIVPLSSYYYIFEIDECDSGDRVTGYYELISSPTTTECNYEEVFEERTVTKTRLVTEEVEKTRKITKTKPLWKKILGIE